MATTKKTHSGNGSATNFTFDFPYIKQADVKVTLDNVATTAYTFANATTISFTSAPANNADIIIYRSTDDSNLVATFYPGSAIRSNDLNDNFTQNLYSTQENTNDASDALDNSRVLESGDYVSAITKATTAIATANTASTNATNAVSTANTASSTATTATNTANTASTNATNAVNTANAASTTAAAAFQRDGSATMTGNIVFEGATDDAHETTVTVVDPTADRTITLPNQSGTVPVLAAASNTQVTATPEELNILDGVTADKDELNLLDGVTSTTAELNILDGVTADKDEINKLDGFTGDKDDLIYAKDLKATGVTATEFDYLDGVTSNVQTQLDAKQALDAELTTLAGMQPGTASILASGTALTSDTSELNLLDGKSVVTSVSGSSTDVQLPTAKAVNDQIVAVINDVGGFVPINDKDSFPETNPDPGDNAGTIVSIADAGGLVVNGSGVSTTGDTISTDATVTINGIDSTLRGTTIAAGKGMLVQTTSTLNTYDYHRLVVDEAGVAAAQTLVTDFNQRYQVAGSAPSNQPDGTALAEGDLFFDTGSNKMMVYDGSDYAVVTSVGDYKILTLQDTDGSAADFTNSSFNLRDGSSAANVTSAGQLIISVNGVIQKPNTGTSAPAEGFALVDADTIIFGAAPGSGASVFVTLIGSATTVNVPADNSVATAKIQNGAVDEARIANDAVTEDKLANSINTAIAANTAKVTNATHTGDVTGSTALTIAALAVETGMIAADAVDGTKIADDSINSEHYVDGSIDTAHIADDAVTGTKIADDTITEANLDVSNAPTNGHYLQAQSGEGGGLTWAAVSAGGLSDTSNHANSLGLGDGALDSEGDGAGNSNIAVGKDALTALTGGEKNVAMGYQAMSIGTGGNNNVALGQYTLQNNTGTGNVAVGYNAGQANTSAGTNTFIGYISFEDNTTGSWNVGLGAYSGFQNTTGAENVIIGGVAGYANTTGSKNVAVGRQAMMNNTTASENVAIGYDALYSNTTASENVCVGKGALYACTTGNNNVTIGRNSGSSITTGTYNICLGDTNPSSATVSQECILGGSVISTLRCNTSTISALSDARDKTEVEPSPLGVEFLNTLNPVKFKWETREKNSKDGTYEIGFIAQELQTVQKESNTEYLKMVLDENPDRLEASYGQLVPILVQAIKELSAQVKELQKT